MCSKRIKKDCNQFKFKHNFNFVVVIISVYLSKLQQQKCRLYIFQRKISHTINIQTFNHFINSILFNISAHCKLYITKITMNIYQMQLRNFKEHIICSENQSHLKYLHITSYISHADAATNDDVANCPGVKFNFLAYLSPILMVGFQ